MRVEGWWLNLPEEVGRSEKLSGNLRELDLLKNYKRYEAERGTDKEAKERGLNVGEIGAWKSWLKMMKTASKSEAKIVHLLEDDIEITKGLKVLVEWVYTKKVLEKNNVICTDAYVTPAQARKLIEHREWDKSWQVITGGLRIPCITSVMANPGTWESIYKELNVLWSQKKKLPPIDIAIGQSKAIQILTVVPFVTVPRVKESQLSQIRKEGSVSLERSREALTLLRRLLTWKKGSENSLWNGEWDEFWKKQPHDLQSLAVLDTLEGLMKSGGIIGY